MVKQGATFEQSKLGCLLIDAVFQILEPLELLEGDCVASHPAFHRSQAVRQALHPSN